MTATITSKGQITIPVEIRRRLHLKKGDRISFAFEPNGKVTLQTKSVPFEKLMGLLHTPGRKPMSVRDMDRARDKALLERWKRISSQR